MATRFEMVVSEVSAGWIQISTLRSGLLDCTVPTTRSLRSRWSHLGTFATIEDLPGHGLCARQGLIESF